MIIIAGEIEIAPDDVGPARDGAIVMMRETVKEKGCIRYRFWADLEHAGRFHVYEEWESADALADHMNALHMQIWRGVLSGVRVVSRDIRKFETEGPQPLG